MVIRDFRPNDASSNDGYFQTNRYYSEATTIVEAAAQIKPGSAGGETAGKRFSEATRQEAFAENPNSICVYCRQPGTATQVDHAIPRSVGGNATIDNTQLACPFCNASKGARQFPVNPAPGYTGPFPPPWWNQ